MARGRASVANTSVPNAPLEIAVGIGLEGIGKGRPVDALRRALEGRNPHGLQAKRGSFRGLVPRSGRPCGAGHSDCDAAFRRGPWRRKPRSCRRRPRAAQCLFHWRSGRSAAGRDERVGSKLLQEALPGGAQGRSGPTFGRMEATRLHGGQEIGPEIVKVFLDTPAAAGLSLASLALIDGITSGMRSGASPRSAATRLTAERWSRWRVSDRCGWVPSVARTSPRVGAGDCAGIGPFWLGRSCSSSFSLLPASGTPPVASEGSGGTLVHFREYCHMILFVCIRIVYPDMHYTIDIV